MQRLVIHVVCHLREQKLIFHGHNKLDDSLNQGNYVETLELVCEFDPVLKQHLETSTGFSGTSNRIQNDLIEAVSKVQLNAIGKETEAPPFVPVLLDETLDTVNKSQLSFVLCYRIKSGDVAEHC